MGPQTEALWTSAGDVELSRAAVPRIGAPAECVSHLWDSGELWGGRGREPRGAHLLTFPRNRRARERTHHKPLHLRATWSAPLRWKLQGEQIGLFPRKPGVCQPAQPAKNYRPVGFRNTSLCGHQSQEEGKGIPGAAAAKPSTRGARTSSLRRSSWCSGAKDARKPPRQRVAAASPQTCVRSQVCASGCCSSPQKARASPTQSSAVPASAASTLGPEAVSPRAGALLELLFRPL